MDSGLKIAGTTQVADTSRKFADGPLGAGLKTPRQSSEKDAEAPSQGDGEAKFEFASNFGFGDSNFL